MEGSAKRISSNREPPISRLGHSLSTDQTQSGYKRYRGNSSYDQNKNYNQ